MEFKKNGINYVKLSCDECGAAYEKRRGNHIISVKRNNGASLCRSCGIAQRNSRYTQNKGTPIHNSYAAAKQRCNYVGHVSYKNYGGRGIKFLWGSFLEFNKDMSGEWFPGATLERVDVDGDYCKDNCVWVDASLQARNTRKNIHTEERVSLIRSLYKNGRYTQEQLAGIFGDSQGNISNIITGRAWKIKRIGNG